VGYMSGYVEVSVIAGLLLFVFYVVRRLSALEQMTELKLDEGTQRLSDLVSESIRDLKHDAVALIDEELPNAFEQIDLMRQQMITQVMGWGMNMLMQKFGGDNPPDLAVAEFEQKD